MTSRRMWASSAALLVLLVFATDAFAQIAARAGRTYWLNPEPRLYWNYGDSVIDTYAQYCEAYECWTTGQLENFVKILTAPEATRP